MHIIYLKNESKGNGTVKNIISFWQTKLQTYIFPIFLYLLAVEKTLKDHKKRKPSSTK